MSVKILIAAGGTGGHLFPALAVVEELKNPEPDIEFEFAGTNRIESRIVPKLGYKFHEMNIYGINKVVSLKTALLPFRLAQAESNIRKILKNGNFDAVICTGAYLSYPPGVAAQKEKKLLFLLESNVNPGKSIKMLSGRATAIFSSFPETTNYFNPEIAKKIIYTGNPVRPEIKVPRNKEESLISFGLNPKKKTLLVFGGSLGANSINNTIEKIVKDKPEYQIIWQTGKNYKANFEIPENVKVLEFIDDMATAYSAADLVMSRSGATTIAELGIVAKPSLLVPLPSASNNEQFHNARSFVEARAAELILDDVVDERASSKIEALINDETKLQEMSKNALNLGKPDAGKIVAEHILKMIYERK